MEPYNFQQRHIGISAADEKEMLKQTGCRDIKQLIGETIPKNILREPMGLPEAMSEAEFLNHFNCLAEENSLFASYIGLGYNPSVTPSVIQRNVLENPGWYTAYTPYQAEISQGRLEALLNYQTMIAELTGLPLANASLLDEGTAAAEAALMLMNTRNREQRAAGVKKFFVSENILPQTLSVLQTRLLPFGMEIVVGDEDSFKPDETYFGAILQYPAKYGEVKNYKAFTDKAHETGVRVIAAADLLSLALIAAPAAWGADVAVGTTQRFGLPMGFGGPAAGYFACTENFKRDMPGRIIGISIDKTGKQALRMALQTREQHIKREKATSNICTSSVLVAVMAGFYGLYHGPEGLRAIAGKIHRQAAGLEKVLRALGYTQLNKNYFDTLLIETSAEEADMIKELSGEAELNLLHIDDTHIGISLNETSEAYDLEDIASLFAAAKQKDAPEIKTEVFSIDKSLLRSGDFMQQEVFGKYRSETEMMRYIKKLEGRDLSLNHSMIPLGSCTMKLNAASEMLTLSHPNWGKSHPFAPEEQCDGHLTLLHHLEDFLAEITGFAAVSLQPNSGASGEYAGLRLIQEYFKDRGEEHRKVCLIPASAHGTNPASAAMAGMEIITVKNLDDGSIDIADLKEKAAANRDNLCCVMITYPSTYGLFDTGVREICDIIHKNGGQVFMDGANMNAQVGLTSPGFIGADVCHLNLHKTFAMPHGGGGPGVGPVCAAEHLATFLPGNPVVKAGGGKAMTSVSSAPYGSAYLDSITYGYILMLGAEGLRRASEIAILNANYLKVKLKKHFSVLYKNDNGRVGHELIIDIRPIKEKYGVDATDFAKRLMDYGFHAPTLSFPVAGTLMIEPTESESREELDRFVESLVNILNEAKTKPELLHNAPHTLVELSADSWELPYTRKEAAYPLDWIEGNKFWPTVKRLDDGYGDRNLVCTLA